MSSSWDPILSKQINEWNRKQKWFQKAEIYLEKMQSPEMIPTEYLANILNLV